MDPVVVQAARAAGLVGAVPPLLKPDLLVEDRRLARVR